MDVSAVKKLSKHLGFQSINAQLKYRFINIYAVFLIRYSQLLEKLFFKNGALLLIEYNINVIL